MEKVCHPSPFLKIFFKETKKMKMQEQVGSLRKEAMLKLRQQEVRLIYKH